MVTPLKAVKEIEFTNEYEQKCRACVSTGLNAAGEEVYHLLLVRSNWDDTWATPISGFFTHEELCQINFTIREVTGI